MNVGRSLGRTVLGLLVVSALLVALVLVNRPSAAPDDRDDAPTNETTPVVVVKTQPNGAIECSDLTSTPRDEGTLVYHWRGPRLQTVRCELEPGGGVVGLG